MIQFLPRTSVPIPDVGKRRLYLDAADNLLKWKLRDGSVEAISSGGGGGGPSDWGGIGGTLTDQTDLTAYVAAQLAGLVDTAPSTLDTLNELAAALGDDPNFAATIATALGLKAPTSRSISTSADLTGGGDLSANRTLGLADTAVTPATYGDATHVAQFTVDQRGRVTFAQNVAISASGGIPSGTSFPGSPASGDIFLRTDRQIIYFYDGTRWLSQQIYTQQIPQSDALLPRNATSTDTGRTLNFWNGQYDMYVLDFVVIYFLTAASTVNFKLTKTDAATNTTMVTSANQTTSGSYTCVRTAVNAVVANTVEQFTNTITFVSGAAGCYPSAGITYRLIG